MAAPCGVDIRSVAAGDGPRDLPDLRAPLSGAWPGGRLIKHFRRRHPWRLSRKVRDPSDDARREVASLPTANDDARESDQAALGALINIAGRQRMLAHRAVMFLALSRVSGVGDAAELLDAAADALKAFVVGVGLLLSGDPERGLAPLNSKRARTLLEGPARSAQTGAANLADFGARGKACLDRLRNGDDCAREVRLLADMAGEVLLPLLNDIVAALEADLADAVAAEAERVADVRAVMTGALEDIEQTATRIRLIAFNALIEAARAGDAGRAFSVIAEEIRILGTHTGEESAKMHAAVRRLFAA